MTLPELSKAMKPLVLRRSFDNREMVPKIGRFRTNKVKSDVSLKGDGSVKYQGRKDGLRGLPRDFGNRPT